MVAFLVEHLVAARASQRSLIEYLNESAEEWDISYSTSGSWPLTCISLALSFATSLVKLKVYGSVVSGL